MHGVEVVEPQHPQPELDNTVKTLFYWVMDLPIPHGPQHTLLTIIKHLDWQEGNNCYVSVPTLARESGFSLKTVKKHLKHLVDAEIIIRKRRMSKSTYTQLAKEVPQLVGEGSTPNSWRSDDATNQSSSNQSNNQSGTPSPSPLPDCIDPEDTIAPSTAPGSGESGDDQSSISEEKTQGQGLPTLKEVNAWKVKHYVKGSLSFKEWAVDYYWYVWGGDYVMGGWDMDMDDVATYYEEVLSEDKFEEDLTAKLLKLRLPNGLIKRTSFRCTECNTMSKKPYGIMVQDGEVVTDGCGNCPTT